ncbi:MAG: C39 family peptidase [Chloroflexota bacterium]|nr:C39 family peptidase [Chloroflexota bacterium]
MSVPRAAAATRRDFLVLMLHVVVVIFLLGLLEATPGAAAASPAAIQFTRFASAEAFGSGALSGTRVEGASLALAPGQVSGAWVSPTVTPGFGFTRLVASWNADTPGASRLRVEAQVTTATGATSDWYVLGVWAVDDQALRRTSINDQADAFGRVDTDTLRASAEPFVSYRLRARLERSSGDEPSPSVRLLGAEVSDFSFSAAPTSTPLTSDPVELAVPGLSQEVHAHQYPQWGGGGEAWCSPTSTQMVIAFWGRGPAADDLAWVDPGYADPSVDFAARSTYDAAYRGTGNWPFNAAYAARWGLEAFVTQLRSLAEAERFVRAGIPLVASIASRPGELDGFLFAGGTNGHLVVIVGFDGSGNPIVNDPAAWSNASVRRIYDRGQFERVWLRGSSGTVYVIRQPDVPLPLPPADATPNW